MYLRSKEVSESVILFHDLDCGSVGDFRVLSDFYTRNIKAKKPGVLSSNLISESKLGCSRTASRLRRGRKVHNG